MQTRGCSSVQVADKETSPCGCFHMARAGLYTAHADHRANGAIRPHHFFKQWRVHPVLERHQDALTMEVRLRNGKGISRIIGAHSNESHIELSHQIFGRHSRNGHTKGSIRHVDP